MKYYLLLILLLAIGCGPSDPELRKIWKQNQAVILTDGTSNFAFYPSFDRWHNLNGQPSEEATYSIKGKNSADYYAIRQLEFKGGNEYEILKVYSEKVEQTEVKPKVSSTSTVNYIWASIVCILAVIAIICFVMSIP